MALQEITIGMDIICALAAILKVPEKPTKARYVLAHGPRTISTNLGIATARSIFRRIFSIQVLVQTLYLIDDTAIYEANIS